tara:strand:- start:249 stop:401 length:153 start_codon:yes stop_codon:yes gene_type:complete
VLSAGVNDNLGEKLVDVDRRACRREKGGEDVVPGIVARRAWNGVEERLFT